MTEKQEFQQPTTCTCDQRLHRFGEFTQPVKFCEIHGDPTILTLADQIAELQRKVDLIMRVDQARSMSRPIKLGKSVARRPRHE
ncbi:hypothetical protein NB640_02815 [Oxalobacter vibrioformis]|uniref:Uncharacterized protein n=1 Tax=Oxalobacter vibrioformis TaxID=933080 RepID=A0A9E9LXD5_9BURK|nr:hypothetical protein [Oxalobacter vibrioformis]WAW10609.1 hypothetical protein NB640_02815 [Oxalobacter vibrioformis]